MSSSEFKEQLQSHLSNLSYSASINFAVSICKALFPDYNDFFHGQKWGDVELLIESIQVCEEAKQSEISSDRVRDLYQRLARVVPDTEEFDDSSYALNAGNAVLETLGFVLDKDKKHLVNIAEYYTDTIDFKIHDREEIASEYVFSHEEMVEARRFLLSLH